MSAAFSPTVQQVLRSALRRYRDRPLLVWSGGEATYGETDERCTALAAWLQQTTDAGARVAILLPNGREYIESILGVALAARVRVPLNPKEAASSIAKKVLQADCAVLISDASGLGHVADALPSSTQIVTVDEPAHGTHVPYSLIVKGSEQRLEAAHPDDIYRLSFTGGTTGSSKAVMQTHGRELAMIRNLARETVVPDLDRTFVAATPLAHAAGAFVVPVVMGGGSIAWLDRFDPDRIVDAGWIDGRRVETFLVPTAMQDVAAAAAARGGHDVASIIYGGAPTTPDVLGEAVDQFGQRLVQVYGQAEAPMTISVVPRWAHADLARVAGSAGWPFLHVAVSILGPDGLPVPDGDVGEVVVAAEHVMAGYWGPTEDDPLDDQGRLHTSDLGRVEDDGLLRLVGRSREMLISGGFNLYPDDIDRRLAGVRGVQHLASFGVPHERWGEALVLAVVVDPGSEDTLDAVARAANERLGSYERPKKIVAVDSLPLTELGKTNRKALADQYATLFSAGGQE